MKKPTKPAVKSQAIPAAKGKAAPRVSTPPPTPPAGKGKATPAPEPRKGKAGSNTALETIKQSAAFKSNILVTAEGLLHKCSELRRASFFFYHRLHVKKDLTLDKQSPESQQAFSACGKLLGSEADYFTKFSEQELSTLATLDSRWSFVFIYREIDTNGKLTHRTAVLGTLKTSTTGSTKREQLESAIASAPKSPFKLSYCIVAPAQAYYLPPASKVK